MTPARQAVRGEIDGDPIDRYTLAHYAVGLGLGAADLPWWAAATFAIAWEFLERPLKDHFPGIFYPSAKPYTTQDTLANATCDAIAMLGGWWVVTSSRRA